MTTYNIYTHKVAEHKYEISINITIEDGYYIVLNSDSSISNTQIQLDSLVGLSIIDSITIKGHHVNTTDPIFNHPEKRYEKDVSLKYIVELSDNSKHQFVIQFKGTLSHQESKTCYCFCDSLKVKIDSAGNVLFEILNKD